MPFTVDTERISAASGDIGRIAAEIEQSVTAMMARLTALQSAWSGAASSEFQATVAQWQAVQARVRENLATIGTLTARAGESYQSTEESVRGLFAR